MIKNLILMYTGGGWWNIYFQRNGEYVLWWCGTAIEEFGCKVYDIDPTTDENEELLTDYDEDQKHTVRELSQDEALEILKEIYPIIFEMDRLATESIVYERLEVTK